MTENDTIYAVATGFGKAAIAVVRVSGRACSALLERICPNVIFPPRQAVLTSVHGADGEVIDHALVLRFVGPSSFTGEDVVEFQVTGSRAVVQALFRTFQLFERVRPAEAGEFARRAFENGKLDLVEIEGLSAVVAAETEAQLRFAQTMVSGVVSRRYEAARALLVHAMADIASMLDFSDVEDANLLSIEEVRRTIREAKSGLSAMLDRSNLAERLREGLTVAIAGPPNAGKSTLLNTLAQRDVALVSPLPGTTRDSLEVFAEVDGLPVLFVDTAGIRETQDLLEAQGIARTYKSIKEADLVLWLSDAADCSPDHEWVAHKLVRVRTKVDIVGVVSLDPGEIAVSALTGFGLEELIDRIRKEASIFFAGVGSTFAGTERQRRALQGAISALEAALNCSDRMTELIAEELRYAANCLERLTGRIGVEEILDDVFGRLCVGK